MPMSFSPKHCPNPSCKFHSELDGSFIRKGFFKLKRLNRTIRRFQCVRCRRCFSSRTFKADYRHKKPDLNERLDDLLCEGVSLRAASRVLRLTYRNTYLKYLWLKKQANLKKEARQFKAKVLQFDEMETIHHTKCKPLCIALIVNENYVILGAKVSEMPCHGKLSAFSRKKYGPRRDDRDKAMGELFMEVSQKLKEKPEKILSDAKPSYRKHVERYFPGIPYETYSRAEKERARDRIHEVQQKRQFDPIFALNQRCAKLRSDIKRLVRRSWCTTKKPENLQGHLDLYIARQFRT